MLTETVYRIRAGVGATNPYSGESDPDWSAPSREELTTVAPAEPRPSQEPVQDARNAVTSGYTLYLPEGSDVTAQDRMEVRGQVFNVLGDPALWLGAGLVVQCGRTEG